MKILLIALVVLLAFAYFTPSEAVVYRLNSEFQFIADSDSEKQYIVGLGGEAIYNKETDTKASLLIGTHTFRNEGTKNFEFLSLKGSTILQKDLRIEGRLSLYSGTSWNPILFGGTLSYKPTAKVYLEASYDRELVDTLKAVKAKDWVDTSSFSVDYELMRELIVVGTYYHQHFKDHNDKDGLVGKLVYTPQKYSWLNLSGYYKRVSSEFKSRLYFSPDKNEEVVATVQIKKAIINDNYIGRLKVGFGHQWIKDSGNHTDKSLSLVEGGIKGWFNDHWGIDIYAGYTNYRKYGNYSRFYSFLSLIYSF